MTALLNLKGQRFGRLVVLERLPPGTGGRRQVRWDCLCDCGNSHSARGTHLTSGNVRSCGCLAKDTARKIINSGEVFGRWTVKNLAGVKKIPGKNNGELFYECVCLCGAVRFIMGSKLRNGTTTSCGCYGSTLIGIRSFKHGLSKTPEFQRMWCANRRARERNAAGNFTQEDVRKIYERQKGMCYYCNIPIKSSFHCDHKTPLSRGGTNHPYNIALTCTSCNCKKYTKTALQFKKLLAEKADGRA